MSHTGDLLVLYFDGAAASGDGAVADDSAETSMRVQHRDLVIQSLRENIKEEQEVARHAREVVEQLQAKYVELEAKLTKESRRAGKASGKAKVHWGTIENLQTQLRAMEGSLAERSGELENQCALVGTLMRELGEQRRVVDGLTDVRATNELLARSLRMERAKLDTQIAINGSLASRVSDLEKENARLRVGTDDWPLLMQGGRRSRMAAEDANVIDLVSEATSDLGLHEDVEAIGGAVAAPWERVAAAPAPRRLGPSFGISVRDFEQSRPLGIPAPHASSTAESTSGGGSGASGSTCAASASGSAAAHASPNPFAVVEKPFASLALRNIVFTQGMAPTSTASARTQKPNRPRRGAGAISDGMGGTARTAAERRRATATIQSQITWPLKQ
ncbi:hypothetical protein LPJ61_000307 [Coemansia biformis]|uniref:Uncharacterized protein n=1 Tax=Coemansia biformis TaxID=1286918 RepID=A0A9W7YJV9_9FUNG|nr:hypothetical protein LPJ61_000307 [Coemansia biformis]